MIVAEIKVLAARDVMHDRNTHEGWECFFKSITETCLAICQQVKRTIPGF